MKKSKMVSWIILLVACLAATLEAFSWSGGDALSNTTADEVAYHGYWSWEYDSGYGQCYAELDSINQGPQTFGVYAVAHRINVGWEVWNNSSSHTTNAGYGLAGFGDGSYDCLEIEILNLDDERWVTNAGLQ